MASSTHRIAPNFRDTIIKAACLRLSDTANRDASTYVDVVIVTGAPSGAYGRAAGTTMLAIREDASSADAALYLTIDGGTTWVALQTTGAGGTQTDLIFAAATELTIASGAITVTQGAHTVDTQADAASDDLDTISGLTAEELVLLRPANAGRTVVIRHQAGGGNIWTPNAYNISLAESTDWALVASDGTNAIVLAASTLADGTLDTFTFSDPTDPTKKVRIDAGTVATATTRVLTMPDADVTFGAYAPTLLNVADEAGFKAAVNLEPGTDVQAYDATLASLAALGTAGDKVAYTTGVDTWAETALTAFARSILDDADEATFKATVNLEIGTDVQAYDAGLADIAALPVTDGNIIVGDGANWVAESGATARASLGLPSLDMEVKATVTVGDATGGSTDAALTLQLYQHDGSTAIGSARQVMLTASATQYAPFFATEASLTFITATTGTIIASAAGWALVETDATGAFACTARNTDDETLYFSARDPESGVSDLTKACRVIGSNSDAAAWSA